MLLQFQLSGDSHVTETVYKATWKNVFLDLIVVIINQLFQLSALFEIYFSPHTNNKNFFKNAPNEAIMEAIDFHRIKGLGIVKTDSFFFISYLFFSI